MTNERRELAKMLAKECHTVSDIQNLLKEVFSGAIEEMLEAELDEHLGYEKHDNIGDNTGNSRNGYSEKTIQSEYGKSTIRIPRDRNSSFEPKVIEKRQTRTEDINGQIIAMYAKGMSTRDIEDCLRDIYGVDASASLISRITDRILPEAAEWQSRPLDAMYAAVFFDGIHFNVRKDGKVAKKCVYSVLAIDMDGYKSILGLWIGESESAAFWLSICNELRNRGVQDILIACHDNLTGLVSAIEAAFPDTEQQLCIIHQIRNSTKHVPYSGRKEVCNDLKKIYNAPSVEAAEAFLLEFGVKWDSKYPQIFKSWSENWAELSAFFRFPQEVRALIYTTNSVEGFHRMLRKFTKTKTQYPGDDALRKSIYLSVLQIEKKWTVPIRNWGVIAGQLGIFFAERIAAIA